MSSLPPITIPGEYGWVILVIGVSHIMNMYLAIMVVQARKTFDVQYPLLYAPETHKHAKAFNSVQRAHQNTLENWAPVMLTMMAVGLKVPTTAAACGAIWVVGRFVYGYGYSKGGPEGRIAGGMISHLGDFPLMLLALYHGVRMVGLF